MIPQNPQEIISQSIKYLYLSRKQLPKPIFHAVLSPYNQWSKAGHILGDTISYLNFPDNSVLFLSEIDSDDNIILPQFDSSIVLPHSPMLTNKILVDNNVIFNIQKYVPNIKIEDSPVVFEQQIAPYISMPLVIEAARIRKRGIPFCTPILFGKKCDRAKLTIVLENLISRHGTGVIILNNSLNSKDNPILKDISLSFIPEIFPLFFDKNYGGITLMTYLAHKFNNPINIINEWKFTENNEILNTFTLGISKNKNYNSIKINNINFRKNIWGNVVNAIQNKTPINIGYKCGVIIKIKDREETLVQKILLEKTNDLGKNIFSISKNILNEIPYGNLENYNMEIIPIIDQENLSNTKNINKINPEQYSIVNQKENIDIVESISKTINNYNIDVNNSFLYKKFPLSLPLNIVLLLHDINIISKGE